LTVRSDVIVVGVVAVSVVGDGDVFGKS